MDEEQDEKVPTVASNIIVAAVIISGSLLLVAAVFMVGFTSKKSEFGVVNISCTEFAIEEQQPSKSSSSLIGKVFLTAATAVESLGKIMTPERKIDCSGSFVIR